MVDVMERSPATFKGMGEEALRDHFLVQLNGHYEGQATGETFNSLGKTDISIREEGKVIFIGECKFWTGPTGMTKALDQLLSYTAWKDTKASLLMFNRNKNLSAVLENIPRVVKGHPNYKREHKPKSETHFRYTFGHPNDTNREISLAVLVFDIPT